MLLHLKSRGPSSGKTGKMVGEEKGVWERGERRVWEEPHPRKEPRNPKEGYRSLPTWFPYGLVELV